MTSDTVGGVFGYSVDLCRAITRAGGHVLLVTLGPRPSPAQRAQLSQLSGVELVATDYKLEWMDDALPDVRRSGEFLQGLAESYRPQLVHLNGYAHGALAFPAPKLVVAHSCVLSWWRAVYGADAPARYADYKLDVVRGLHAADVVVAPSRTMLRALHSHYTRDLRAVVIPNAAPTAPDAQRTERTRRGICSAGRLWDPAKNLALVLNVARRSRWHFRVAGALNAPEESSPQLAALDVPGNVELLGNITRAEVARVMAESAIYVHPARYEPFGLAVLEAAQAGCALVLSDIPSMRELWHGAACFVPALDAEALHQVLEQLREQPALVRTLAHRARARASRYGYDSFSARYLALYADLRRKRALSEIGRSALGGRAEPPRA
jgi:glycosyltransferase involved in cell wall biosynthesis